MILSRRRSSHPARASRRLLSAAGGVRALSVLAAGLAAGGALAQDNGHCALYGAVDVGNGGCARVIQQQYGEAGSRHVRVDLGGRAAAGGGWTAGGTANAALRSDGLGMLPGAADAQHLRVPGALYGR